MEKTVYVVHCIDTEGPMYESLPETFKRIKDIFDIELKPTQENLLQLQQAEISLDGKEEAVQNLVAPKRINFLSTWDQIDQMLNKITDDSFRHQYADSYNKPWRYNWLCMDHVGITGNNPRRKDLGHHNIFDHYREWLQLQENELDDIQWHYHALSITNDSHRAGTTYLNNGHVTEILARKVIDRQWFPAVFRPGMNAERPDVNWLLEQWIPFDYGNHRLNAKFDQPDVTGSRFGDWRRAPESWLPYHPSYEDYQSPGNMKRWIARCLCMESRVGDIGLEDVKTAFREADEQGKSLLSFFNHDFRDMEPEIKKVYGLIMEAQKSFPEITFKHVTAVEGIRRVLDMEDVSTPGLTANLSEHNGVYTLHVNANEHLFGVQPFLAIKNRSNQYYWQNFDFDDDHEWSYTFDYSNLDMSQVESIGIAANSTHGVTQVINIQIDAKDPGNADIHERIFNDQKCYVA